jgi:DNA excision repair protein ERCC-2
VITKLLKEKIVVPEIIFNYSKEEFICPAEIMFDIAASSDILIGDYNYVFDPRVQLKRIFQRDDLTDWLLIIDEAHNLYQRTIDSLSPELKRTTLSNLSKALLNDKLKIYRSLKQQLTSIAKLFESLHQEGVIHYPEQRYFTFDLDLPAWQETFREFEKSFIKYLIFKIRKNMLILEDPFEAFYYQLRSLVQIAGIQSDEFISFYDAAQKGKIKIECCDPSQHIQNIIQKFHSVIAMSATLDPINYYQEILGFPENNTRLLEVSSTFSTRNRQVVILPNISTYYRDRFNLYERYAEIVKDVISIKKGNYIVFCPSFEFLQNLILYLGTVKSEIITQRRQMVEEDRDYILSQLKESDSPTLLLAVMGGIFSEGVDFRGDMCIGVIIFSPGFPQITFERELIRQYYDSKQGNGFNYAYLYPGINKVIQSVGRLIRSQQDKGVIILAGERFADDEINQLFPDYWFEVEGDVVITEDLKKTIETFWQRFE